MFSLQNQRVDESKAGVCKELRSMVQDAHTALADLRSRNAEQAFSQALALLETNKPKVIMSLVRKPVPKHLVNRVFVFDCCSSYIDLFIHLLALSCFKSNISLALAADLLCCVCPLVHSVPPR